MAVKKNTKKQWGGLRCHYCHINTSHEVVVIAFRLKIEGQTTVVQVLRKEKEMNHEVNKIEVNQELVVIQIVVW